MPVTQFEECWPLPADFSFWTPLKSQRSNPNPYLLANQLWCIDFITPPTPLILPHRLYAFLESLTPLKNWCSRSCKMVEKQYDALLYVSVAFFSKFKNTILLHIVSSKVSLTSRLHFFEFTSCDNQALVECIPIAAVAVSFEPEIRKIEFPTNLNACTKKSLETYWRHYVWFFPSPVVVALR